MAGLPCRKLSNFRVSEQDELRQSRSPLPRLLQDLKNDSNRHSKLAEEESQTKLRI